MTKKTVLIVGGTGTIGTGIVRAFAASDDYEVYATTRKTEYPFPEGVHLVTLDILDQAAVERTIKALPPITHFIYTAIKVDPEFGAESTDEAPVLRQSRNATKQYLDNADEATRESIMEQIGIASSALTKNRDNVHMFDYVLTALEEQSDALEFVGLVTGGKAYGMHLGPIIYEGWQDIVTEDAPVAPGPTYYQMQEARVIEGAQQHGYAYTVTRPPYMLGYAQSSGYNILTGLGVYAALLKYDNKPLIFPGDTAAAQAMYEWCDIDLHGDVLLWAASEPRARNQILNVSHGDPCPIGSLWEGIAAALDMEAEFYDEGFAINGYLNSAKHNWAQVVAKYNLQPTNYDQLSSGSEMNTLAMKDYGLQYDLTRLRSLGYTQSRKTQEVFTHWLSYMREQNIIP